MSFWRLNICFKHFYIKCNLFSDFKFITRTSNPLTLNILYISFSFISVTWRNAQLKYRRKRRKEKVLNNFTPPSPDNVIYDIYGEMDPNPAPGPSPAHDQSPASGPSPVSDPGPDWMPARPRRWWLTSAPQRGYLPCHTPLRGRWWTLWTTKFLGVHLNSLLDWSDNTDAIHSKARAGYFSWGDWDRLECVTGCYRCSTNLLWLVSSSLELLAGGATTERAIPST